MKFVLGLFICVLFTSCKSITIGGNSISIDPLIQEISGQYRNCTDHNVYNNYYSLVDVTIVQNKMTVLTSTHASSNCTDPYGHIKEEFTVDNISVDNIDPSILNVDLKLIKYSLYPTHSYYPSQNYCGIVGMPLNEYTDLTGFSCPNFLTADSHHSSILSKGDIKYTTIKVIDGQTLQVISGFAESGDTEVERQVTDLFVVNKI